MIMLFLVLSVLIFGAYNEARAETYNINPTNQWNYTNNSGLSNSWSYIINNLVTPSWDDNLDYLRTSGRYDNYYGNQQFIQRAVAEFDLSEIPVGATIYSAKLKWTDHTSSLQSYATTTLNLFEFNKVYNSSNDFLSFGNTALSGGSTFIKDVTSYGALELVLNNNGIIYLNDRFNNASTTTYLGARLDYDYFDIRPPAYDSGNAIRLNGISLEIDTTAGESSTKPITLIYPLANSSQSVQINQPISTYTLFRLNGTCAVSGEDRVYVHNLPNSYTPDSDDFNDQGIDCINGQWSYYDVSITDGLNYYTIFSRDFIDESRSPVYNYDYVSTEVNFYVIMSFAPTTPTTSLPTTTLDSLWLTPDLSGLPLIGNLFTQVWDHIRTRFPWGYLDQIWAVWKSTSASSQDSLGFELVLDPDITGNATTTVSFPLTTISDNSPWGSSAYRDKLDKIEAKVEPWIWIMWSWFYLKIIIQVFKKKIHSN